VPFETQDTKETHMLFGACNCTPAGSGLSRRGFLCAGGAGFITGVLGTLFGSGRTAQAKTLSGPVPEVERLNVTIVDDIMVRRNVATQKLEGLTIERAQPNEIPDKAPRATLVGEWGLSMHAESHRGDEIRQILVDFGTIPSRYSTTWKS
jgi:7,8-dihydropterin-6-yl-methyl-4-(beta-D-ribofuranosyl)aminobenzene 5'-phosphate synthase